MIFKKLTRVLVIILIVFCVIFTAASCQSNPTDQEIIAAVVLERFNDIDQFSFDGGSMSLNEAESILYCWASGENDISDEMLREAILAALACNDEVRDLIYSIDEIDLEDWRN